MKKLFNSAIMGITLGICGLSTTHATNPSQTFQYPHFPYNKETVLIERHAQRYGVPPELLMAIRIAEGNESYGIKPQGSTKKRFLRDGGYYDEDGLFKKYESGIERNIAWAAATVSSMIQKKPESQDLIHFLAGKYAPIKVKNDPRGLNKYWPKNVKHHFEKIKSTKIPSPNHSFGSSQRTYSPRNFSMKDE